MNKISKSSARIIAFYLPQFHPIPENDAWWGKGFTEWISVVQAKKLFPKHKQPHLPADLGFYDLRLSEIREKQAELAINAGIEGFCYWHYWFGKGKRLLEAPFNEVVRSGKPDFPFCLAWANHPWERKLWDKKGTSEILMEQLYPGEEDYIDHFYSLLPAFKDKRYIRVDGKLLFVIYIPDASPEILLFMNVWRRLAKENGLNDFFFIARDSDSRKKEDNLKNGFDAIYNDNTFDIHHKLNIISKGILYIQRSIFHMPTVFKYKKAINYMITEDAVEENVIPVIVPNWDHSPRSGGNAIILSGAQPKYFKELVLKALNIVKNKPAEKQIIFLKSWNEWGEGNYMEPDLDYGHENLEALRNAIKESK